MMDGFHQRVSPHGVILKRVVLAHFFLALLLLAITGCGPRHHRADIVIMNGSEPESIDPHLSTSQPDGRIVDALFEGLVRPDPATAQPIPGLAERWDLSPDRRTYTFYIRPTARWSTGQPITAHDFVYSWRRALAPETAADYAGLLYPILHAEGYNRGLTNPATGHRFTAQDVGVSAPQEGVLRVELTAPVPYFLHLCMFRTYATVPRHLVEQAGERWTRTRPLPSSGAYTLDYWRLNDRARLRKNPLYWDATNTRNNVVDFIPTEQPNVALNLYLTGQADMIWDRNLTPAELFDLLRQRPDCHVYDYLGAFFLRFNVTRPPFDDTRVRRAFVMALDRRQITDRITRGGEKPVSHFTPAGIPGYTPPEGLSFNPAEARRLLAEAGYPEGNNFPPVQYLMNTSRLNEQIAVELQAMWRETLGVTIEIKQVEAKIFFKAQSSKDYHISRSSWIADFQDPVTFLELFTSGNGNNRTGWQHAGYDRLMEQAALETRPEERMRLLQKAETILVRDEAPILPLFSYVGVEFYDNRRIQGIHPNPLALHPVRAIRKDWGPKTKD